MQTGLSNASPGDETSASLDSAVVDAAIEAFTGTGKPYLHISGQWIYGSNLAITEDSPVNAPALRPRGGNRSTAGFSTRTACAEL